MRIIDTVRGHRPGHAILAAVGLLAGSGVLVVHALDQTNVRSLALSGPPLYAAGHPHTSSVQVGTQPILAPPAPFLGYQTSTDAYQALIANRENYAQNTTSSALSKVECLPSSLPPPVPITRPCLQPPPQLMVDSVSLGQSAVLVRMLAVAQYYNLETSSPLVAEEATAEAVLDHLLLVEGQASGMQPSWQAAAAHSQEELAGYKAVVAAGQQQVNLIPPGVSPEQYFSSPTTISHYRDFMTIASERNAVLARASGSRQAKLAAWLTSELTSHTVRIDGAAPTFDLAAALPPDL